MNTVLSSASAIASKVSTSAHTTLSKIFGKSSSKGTIKKKTKAKATSVILLPSGSKTVPRGRKREQLRDSGHVQSCYISIEDDCDTLSEKIVSMFPSLKIAGFKIMNATKSGDLFEAQLPQLNGEFIMELTGNGPLFIIPRAAVVAPIVSPQVKTESENEITGISRHGMH